MVRFCFLIALLAVRISLADPWTPPVGIPYPSFGITNSHWMYADAAYTWDYGAGPEAYRTNEFGPYTHYIDNSHPNSTDTANPYGSPARPRRTWVYPLPAGAAVQVHGGPYDFNNAPGAKLAAGGNGTEALPIFFYGTSTNRSEMPSISSGDLMFFGNQVVLEKFIFTEECLINTRPELKGAPVINVAVRDCELIGSGMEGNHNAFGTGGPTGSSAVNYTLNFVILRNNVHDYGDWLSPNQNDSTGMIIGEFATNVWILDNTVYRMGGDGVRIGADQGGPPSGGFYYVGRNHLHHNRENAIDIKQARNSVLSENVVHSFLNSSSSSGAALTMHYLPENIWLLNNTIYDCERGIVSSGVGADCYIIGNLAYGCREKAFFLDRGGGTFHVLNNTIANCGDGISTTGVPDALHYKNNIISHTPTNTFSLQLTDSSVAAASTAYTFLFNRSDSGYISWGGKIYNNYIQWTGLTGKGDGSMNSDPQFLNVALNDYHITPASPAIENGLSIADYDTTFQAMFGVSMMRDIDGNPREVTESFDFGDVTFANIGAYSYRAPVVLRRNASRGKKFALSTLIGAETAAPGYTISVRLPSNVSQTGSTLTIQGSSLIYEPLPGNNADDHFAYIINDGQTEVTLYADVMVDSPPTASTFNITGSSDVSGSMHITAAGIPSRSYKLQSTSSLNPPITWDNVGVPQTASAGTGRVEFVDPSPGPTTYYRVIEAP